ncbi:MAG: hypothetical protein EPO36_05135 [Chloroflexota bacterium]|nr:MAG: hypothetical protein EPO36_05135 [Chloroflexota bacterium]
MKRMLTAGLTAALLLAAVPGFASAGGPPLGFAGVWTAVDCATWWEETPDGHVVDCDVWGDGSTIILAVGRGANPHVFFADTYSSLCADQGLPTSFSGVGRGTYEQASGMLFIHVDTTCGSVSQGWLDIGFYRDPGSDTLWSDDDGDGWGWALTRLL